MSRLRTRVCLQDGPFLDLNWLARNGFVKRGAKSPERDINWVHSLIGLVETGAVSADMSGISHGWLKVRIGDFVQELSLMSQSRHFGGRQWYFACPATGRPASVVWKPAGASQFCSRHAWEDQVAYLTQFGNWIDRAHLGKARIAAKLSLQGRPIGCNVPKRPRGMRMRTYMRFSGRFDRYQMLLDDGLVAISTRLDILDSQDISNDSARARGPY